MKLLKFFVLGFVVFNLTGCVTTGQYLYQSGHQNFAVGNLNRAISYYEQALEKEPQNTFYAGNLVIAYVINGQKDRALQLSQQLVKDFPDDGFAYISLGISKMAFKKYSEAVDLMIDGIEVNKKNPKEYSKNLEKIAPLWLGVAYLLNKDFNGATKTFEDNLKHPFADKIMNYTGLIITNYKLLNSEKVFDNIIHVFEISGWSAESASKIAKNPKKLTPKKANIDNISKVIVLQMYLQDYDKGRELAQSLIEVNEYAGALMTGLVELGELRRDSAMANFEITSKVRPYNMMAIWILAMDKASRGDFDDFLKDLYSVTTIASAPQRDYWQEAANIQYTLDLSRQIQSSMGR